VLNAQEVFLEDAEDIHFEYHQNHRPFLQLQNHPKQVVKNIFLMYYSPARNY
jgi:hypothetical protein